MTLSRMCREAEATRALWMLARAILAVKMASIRDKFGRCFTRGNLVKILF